MTAGIVVGYNGTVASREAVEWAADEAAARDVALTVVACAEVTLAGDGLGVGAASSVNALVDASDQLAREVAAAVAAERPGLHVGLVAEPGPPSRVLVDMSADADLVVVGASGHHGLVATWLGSTPRFLVRRASCPVVVVRGSATRGRPDRIVGGVDDSAASTAAIVWACAEADRRDVPLHLVHAWWYQYGTTSASAARDLTRVDAELVLERGLRTARENSLGTVTTELREADPVPGLLDALRDGDLLVLAASGRGAVSRGLVGSTVNGVLDAAHVPVVVIPTCR